MQVSAGPGYDPRVKKLDYIYSTCHCSVCNSLSQTRFREPPLDVIMFSSTYFKKGGGISPVAVREKIKKGEMKASNRLIILMVILATLLLSLSCVGSTMENTKERPNLAADDQVELKSMQDSKATTKSWTRWAKEKLAGFGIGKDKAEEAAGDIATKTQKKASDIASGAAEVKEGMKGNAVPDAESNAAAADKASEMKEKVMDTAANVVKESASDKATMADGANVKDAERAYENAKLKAAEAYKTARDGAKETYEAAKEKVSEATGNVGAQYMNYEAAEL